MDNKKNWGIIVNNSPWNFTYIYINITKEKAGKIVEKEIKRLTRKSKYDPFKKILGTFVFEIDERSRDFTVNFIRETEKITRFPKLDK